MLRDWQRQNGCAQPKFSCDKDAPFEPESDAGASRAVRGLRLAIERKLRIRISAAGFLAALVLCLVVAPFVQHLKHGQLYDAVLFTIVMCTGLIASGSRRRLAFVLVSFVLITIWLNQLWPARCPALTFILPAVVFLAAVTISLLRFILRAKRVDANVLCAGISIYLILGLLWSLAYTFVAQIDPNAFSFNNRSAAPPAMKGFTAMYFSFTTLMTVGYGDITPMADVARMLAMLEAMTGTLFVGVMIARLVSLYSAPGHSRAPAQTEGGNHNR